MPDSENQRKIYSLLDITSSIQKTIANTYTGAYWIKAEMNKLNYYKYSGHCYPDLVEKQDNKTIAQIRANIWKSDYIAINNKFLKILKEPLKDGIKVLILARVSFDPVHGLALRILDIDPQYTLGDLEREKQLTIARLKDEGIFNLNKTLTLPILPQRLAVISVETSKGYADFIQVINHNQWGYKFFHMLFPTVLQGEKAVEGIIRQLMLIKKVKHHFDLVAIIRGGGGDIGLSCYNSYELCRELANFPLPVITGIGHATNETVAEMLSHSNAITPTKLADFLIQHFHNFSVPLQNNSNKLIEISKRLINEQKNLLKAESRLCRSATAGHIQNNRGSIAAGKKQLKNICHYFFKRQAEMINHSEKNISNMSPANVLKRGYSITRINNKSLLSPDSLKEGDTITTILFEGELESKLIEIRKNKKI